MLYLYMLQDKRRCGAESGKHIVSRTSEMSKLKDSLSR